MKTNFFRTLLTCVAAVAALAPAVGACGGDNNGDTNGDGGDNDGGGPIISGNGDGGNTTNKQCATATKKAEVVPVDLMIGLDTSFSMDFDKKWISVQAALKSFSSNKALDGLGLGLQYFPIRKQCAVDAYAQPAVAVADLPGVATSIAASLDGQQMSGGTPMVPMLQGLNTYMKGFATAHPDRKPVIVLATDGIPDDSCLTGTTPNTIDNAVAAAKASFAGSPSVSVFVIGVGSELTALNAIGQAGGTGNAILVDTTKDVEKAFLDALTSIRRQAIPCDYAIPSLGSAPDPAKININYVDAAGQSVFLYVGTAADCVKAEENGWYFDDPNAPNKVVLCPKTCEKVKSNDNAKIDVVFGCDRVGIK